MYKQLSFRFFITIFVIISSSLNARGSLYNSGTDLGYGWKRLDWFGLYYPMSSDWTYHLQHEWIYSPSVSFNSFWYWSEKNMWCWTSQSVYPWVWFEKEQTWKYFFKETGNWVENERSANSNDESEFDSFNPPKTWNVHSASNLEMIWVEPGTFEMGIYNHHVQLTKGFYLGKYEVTQAEYEAVMNLNSDGLATNPSAFDLGSDYPVEFVSWDNVQIFLSILNAAESSNTPKGWAFELPTEAEWEYACRAGTTTTYHWGDSITFNDANYGGGWKNIGHPQAVGQYNPNPWGFYDMLGNISEWTADYYGYSGDWSEDIHIDPKGPLFGPRRVIKGGSWETLESLMGPKSLSSKLPDFSFFTTGFRLALKKIN